MRDPRSYRPLGLADLLYGDSPASSLAAAAAPEPSIGQRIVGGLSSLAALPLQIPEAIGARLQSHIDEARAAPERRALEFERQRLENAGLAQRNSLASVLLPAQEAEAQGQVGLAGALDQQIAQTTDPRLKQGLLRLRAGGPLQAFDALEPSDLEKATYSTVLGIGADQAGQMLRQKNALELAKQQNSYQLEQIAATGRNQLGVAALKSTLPDISDVAGLRKEYTAQSKDFSIVRDAAKKIQAVAKEPSAAGDLSLVFNYMKLLDPGSSVRETEQASARNAAGVPDIIRNTWNRVLTGENLTPAQRADFLAQAAKVFDSHLGTQLEQEGKFSALAQRLGARPEDVVDIGIIPQELRGSLSVKVPGGLAGNPEAEAIREAVRSGKLSRAEGRSQLEAIRGAR